MNTLNILGIIINAGTLLTEVGMWFQAVRSLRKTEESIIDTNAQNNVHNQRDLWKEAIIAYRKLEYASDICADKINHTHNYTNALFYKLRFLNFITDWSREYLLNTHLVDRKFIKQYAGKQLLAIYKNYSNLLHTSEYNSDLVAFKEALHNCDIL